MSSGITVSIEAGKDQESSTVIASGSTQHIITDKERDTFHIQDTELKNAVGKHFGKNPKDAYVKSPTPWNDLYTTYGWPQVQTVLVVKSSEIIGVTSEPVILNTVPLINNSSKPGTFHADTTVEVTNTTETNWSNSNSIETSQSIDYHIGFLGTGGGGETSMSYSHIWGQGGSESETIKVGSSQGVSVELDPGEAVDVVISASKGVLQVRITYEAHLIGDTAVNYDPVYKDHHFHDFGIGDVMQDGGIINSVEIKEDIEVGYFANATVEMRDHESGKTIAKFSL